MQPWRNWFHCTGSMYGQWLPGDDRGWRERDHRRHIDADYKHPFPKGEHEGLYEYSKEQMNREPVELSFEARAAVCKAFFEAMIERAIEVVEMSIGARHWHALNRFLGIDQASIKTRDPKILIGAAKGKCAYILGKQEIVKPGGIWAHGCRTLPVEDEDHFWNTKDYIHDHLKQGAAVLSELIALTEPRP